MVRTFLSKAALLLALILLLAAPVVQAAEPELRRIPAAGGMPGLEELLARAWRSLASVWEMNGCRIDPNGGCLPEENAGTDNGCGIDPDGRCRAGENATTQDDDNGCGLDPSGGCH